jgi:cell division protein FtsQ
MDPRIKRRRIDVTRDAGRKRLHMLIGSVVAAVMAVGAVASTRSPVLDVDHVVVVGATHTTAEQVATAARLVDKPQLLDVNEHGVARRVERLPWVATATAHRQFPATVKVVVKERVVTASVPAHDGKWAVADGTGRVLELVDQRPGIPLVAGTAPAQRAGTRLGPRGRDAMRVAAALPMELRSRTVEILVDPAGEVELHILPGGTIKLGPVTRLDEKLQSAWTVLSGLDPRTLRVLDVRVPRAPVVIRR